MTWWDADEPPEDVRERVKALEAWATHMAADSGLAVRVRLLAICGADPSLEGCDAELVTIILPHAYLADPKVPDEDIQFIIGHELGNCKQCLMGSALSGHAREFDADCFAAGLVGTDAAIAATRRYREWCAQHGTPLREDSPTHPSTEARIRNLRKCSSGDS